MATITSPGFIGPTPAELQAQRQQNFQQNLQGAAGLAQRAQALKMQDQQERWNRLMQAKPAGMEMTEFLSSPGGIEAAQSVLGANYFSMFKKASKGQLEALAGGPMTEDAYRRFSALATMTQDLGRAEAPQPSAASAIPASFQQGSVPAAPAGAGAPMAAAPAASTAPVAPGVGPDQGVFTAPAGPSGASGGAAPAISADRGSLFEAWKKRYSKVLGYEPGSDPVSQAQLRNVFNSYADQARVDESFKKLALNPDMRLAADAGGLFTSIADKTLAQSLRDNTPGAIRDPAGQAFVMAFNDVTQPMAAAGVGTPAAAAATLADPEASLEARGAAARVAGAPVGASPTAVPPPPAGGRESLVDYIARQNGLNRDAVARMSEAEIRSRYRSGSAAWDSDQALRASRGEPTAPTGVAGASTAIPASSTSGGPIAPGGATAATEKDALLEKAYRAKSGEADVYASPEERAQAEREFSRANTEATTELRKSWKVNPEVRESAYRSRLETARKYMESTDPGGSLMDHPVLAKSLLNWDKQAYAKGEADIRRALASAGLDEAQTKYMGAKISAEMVTADALASIAASEAAQKTVGHAITFFDKTWGPAIAENAKKFAGDPAKGFDNLLKTNPAFADQWKQVAGLLGSASGRGEVPVQYSYDVFKGISGWFGKATEQQTIGLFDPSALGAVGPDAGVPEWAASYAQ